MTRALVLHAHPVPESFGAALHAKVLETLAARGWELDDCDLYAEGFDPILSCEERRGYHDLETNTAPVSAYVERLRAADALVLVFPVWNFGYPAILKGFFDRVFLPGVSFRMADGKVAPALSNIRRLAAVTTYGGSRWRAMLAGDPPRKVVTRALRFVCGPAVRMRYLALYDMNRADAADRAAFLARVGRDLRAL
jgi:putative NADPH-quinone reductase